jgi:hypothetical protein
MRNNELRNLVAATLAIAAALGAREGVAQVVPVQVATAAFACNYHGFAVDPSDGTYYSRPGFSAGASLRSYATLSAFLSNTPSAQTPLQGGGFYGTYFAVQSGKVLGRTTNNSNGVGRWDAATGVLEATGLIPNMGGVNGTDTFNWGGFSGVNWMHDGQQTYVVGTNSAGGGSWQAVAMNGLTTLGATPFTPPGIPNPGWGFVINGRLFISPSYNSNLVTQMVDLAGSGLPAVVNYSLPGLVNPYVNSTFYDPIQDVLYLYNRNDCLLYSVAAASVEFNAPAPTTAIDCADWESEVGTWGPGPSPCGDLTSTANTVTYESASFATVYGDSTYEAEIVCTRPVQPTAANTLFVRGTPQPYQTAAQWWNSGIAFNISMNGKYSIFRYQGTKMTPLQSWTTPAGNIVNPSGLPNTLKIEASGGTLTFSINGTPVKTVTGQTLLTGKVGLGMVRSLPTTQFGPNDTLVVNSATVTAGAPLRPARVGLLQEKANQDANRALPSPDPLFAPMSSSGIAGGR